MKFIKKTMKRFGHPGGIVPVVNVIGKLRSYRAAMKMIGNAACQVIQRWFNNRESFRSNREEALAEWRQLAA